MGNGLSSFVGSGQATQPSQSNQPTQQNQPNQQNQPVQPNVPPPVVQQNQPPNNGPTPPTHSASNPTIQLITPPSTLSETDKALLNQPGSIRKPVQQSNHEVRTIPQAPPVTRRTAHDQKYHRRVAQTGGVNRYAFKRAGKAEFVDDDNRQYISYDRVFPHIDPAISPAQVYKSSGNSRVVRYTVMIPPHLPSTIKNNSIVHLKDNSNMRRSARVVGVYQYSPSYRTYNVDLRF